MALTVIPALDARMAFACAFSDAYGLRGAQLSAFYRSLRETR